MGKGSWLFTKYKNIIEKTKIDLVVTSEDYNEILVGTSKFFNGHGSGVRS